MQLRRKRFDKPDETRTFTNGKIDVIQLGELVIGRAVYQPGWRWSEHVKPIAGTESCQFHHVGYVMSGRLRVETDGGASLDVSPGDAFEFPPGHDAWVVGDEPWVSIDYTGRRMFGRAADADATARVLSTVVFTDLSDSTRIAREMGDGRWAALLADHNQLARVEIERWNGREVATTGDGFLLTFDSPNRAVRAARALVATAGQLGLRSRAGVHIGEVELVGDEVRGIAVHAAARILALATAGEVLVSDTVRDLLAGSGLSFADRGIHELRGLPGSRSLFALV